MMHLTENQEKHLFEMGRLGFTYKEVAENFGLSIQEVAKQFYSERGNIYEKWRQGYLQAVFDIRQKILDGALMGSSSHIHEMLNILASASKQNEDADESL